MRHVLKMLKRDYRAEMGDYLEDVLYTDNNTVPHEKRVNGFNPYVPVGSAKASI